MPGPGFEPGRALAQGILSPLCLPVPPPRRAQAAGREGVMRKVEAASGFEPLDEGFADPSLNHLGTPPFVANANPSRGPPCGPLRGLSYHGLAQAHRSIPAVVEGRGWLSEPGSVGVPCLTPLGSGFFRLTIRAHLL